MEPIKQIDIKKEMKVSEIVEQMKDAGFGARKVGEAVEIFEEMIKDRECKIFFGVAGAMVPGGMRKVIMDVLEHVDVFVTTGANLTHDLIENLGGKHYKGSEKVDDIELHEKGVDRIYDVFMENSVYPVLEDFFEKNWDEISKAKNIKELLWKLGELTGKGILGICWEKKIPVFCPAIADSGIGLMIWGRKVKGKEISIDAFDDMKEIIDIAWKANKRGVLYVGGGFPKNFIQQSLQFSKGADYGIQITTDTPEAGGSSGAELKEGISWGKMSEKGRFVNVNCDATIALPLIYSALRDKL